MKRTNWPVGDEAIRPVSADQDICSYCGQERGWQHLSSCVMRRRSVVVELRLQFVRLVTEADIPEQINFWLNEGTRCADNTIEELYRRSLHWQHMTPEAAEEHTGITCFCSVATEKYVREANEFDERYHGVFVAKVAS